MSGGILYKDVNNACVGLFIRLVLLWLKQLIGLNSIVTAI
jgi:hypothetical protein